MSAGPFFLVRGDRALTSVSGADRKEFLQRLLSNDVASLAAGERTGALLLTPKGKLVAPFDVLELKDRFLLDYPVELREPIRRKLSMYVLRLDVLIRDETDELALLSIFGPGGDRAAEAVATDGIRAPAHLYGPGTIDLLLPVRSLVEVVARLEEAGAAELSAGEAEPYRIAAGEARWGSELREGLLPPEVPALVSRAVSYTKGCYVGQETIARIRTYGHVNRQLERIELTGEDLPEPGTEIHEGAMVTSSARHPATGVPIVLAFVRRRRPAERGGE